MAEVGLFAMKRDQINRAILPFAVAGIEVDIVQMSPIALYNFITFDQLKGSGSKDSVVLLDIGADNTDLIITDGTRIWQRNVPIGGNHFTRALTKELKLTFAKAEHLKRNATKAPDPRAIFTAMRGVFNDFASEINRSIGFYSSINRTAKIRKIVGMGNGFKLPGLAEVSPAEPEPRGRPARGLRQAGRETRSSRPRSSRTTWPRSPSLTGWGFRASTGRRWRTNLLPPEIERVRLIRAKKPWALAASALIMLGLTLLFTPGRLPGAGQGHDSSVQGRRRRRPRRVSKQGRGLRRPISRRPRASGTAKYGEGKALIIDPTDRAMWPQFLKTISSYFPDPVRDYRLDPDAPEAQDDAREAAGAHRRDQARLADRPQRRVVRPDRPHISRG